MKPTRILIAEDEPHIRQYLLDCLDPLADAEIVAVESGEAALERLETEPWDVVISDQRMALVGGVEVLKRALELHPRSQRAMLTGFAEIGLLADAKNDGGIHRFITKPISPDRLMEEVSTLVSKAREDAHRAAAFGRALGAVEPR